MKQYSTRFEQCMAKSGDLERRRDLSRADRVYADILHQDPSVAAAWIKRADIALRQQYVDRAIAHIEAGLAASPDAPSLLLILIRLYRRMDRFDDAAATIKKLPDRNIATVELAKVMMEGRTDRALDLAAVALETGRRKRKVWRDAIDLFLSSEKAAAALEKAEQAGGR